MARGWESKSVEEQQDAAAARRTAASKPVPPESAQLERQRRRAGIELSMVRVRHDLVAAKHPRHRQQIEAALRHLEEQLKLVSE